MMVCYPVLHHLFEDGAETSRTLFELFNEEKALLLQRLVIYHVSRETLILRFDIDHLVYDLLKFLNKLREL